MEVRALSGACSEASEYKREFSSPPVSLISASALALHRASPVIREIVMYSPDDTSTINCWQSCQEVNCCQPSLGIALSNVPTPSQGSCVAPSDGNTEQLSEFHSFSLRQNQVLVGAVLYLTSSL